MQQGSSFLTELKHLPTEAASAGTRYNVPLINSLVLYVGMQAIQQLQARMPQYAIYPNCSIDCPFESDVRRRLKSYLDLSQGLVADQNQ
ncbi:hypothetical protein ACFX2A_041504 [Malus domestica]